MFVTCRQSKVSGVWKCDNLTENIISRSCHKHCVWFSSRSGNRRSVRIHVWKVFHEVTEKHNFNFQSLMTSVCVGLWTPKLGRMFVYGKGILCAQVDSWWNFLPNSVRAGLGHNSGATVISSLCYWFLPSVNFILKSVSRTATPSSLR